ncbi:MAG: hypothetical protein CO156_01405 [Candidatus Pacebacteria bacterium CG_4_9_14_3_um_filter_40_12]|nr:MAG: hypothetical protein COU64_00230 [Candidatus Pacebacteria bacterium CG10_big_fil_rev_8_21_14_0_10_40_26]PIZ79071.1 MAG: hypothetical protein COY01_01430 [Candidatus Pacebacteria bacterium CG_4_10_14_0_2_um_filter_40_20]PJA69241.1 MAG: hypothetical protein CO156_01405 [Candidatus Pacebacteria bacterium CG_4_9_14_3_um_filter_40_12]PJC42037.1 MAG: hypothetical protein CO041_00140 [Candidatus Pacebacteria bacterium CG_4_9_14_0_2_um_filter_40_15]
MLTPKQSQSGLTLIEMIITVSIMLVLFGGSIAGFFKFNDRQNVANTMSEVKQQLESARTRARVRDNPNQAGCVLQGYKVKTNGTSLESKILCGTSKFSLTEGQNRDVYEIQSGVTVTAMDITFYTLTGSALVTSPASNFIHIEGNNTYYAFEVKDSGEISEGCFVVSSGSTTCL